MAVNIIITVAVLEDMVQEITCREAYVTPLVTHTPTDHPLFSYAVLCHMN